MTSSTQFEVISDICDSTTANNDIKFMLKLAKRIREQILSQDWKFTGHFSTYKTPALLSIFLKWVPFGACVSAEKDDTKEIESLLNVIGQFISQNVITNRQTNYHLQQNTKTIAPKIETPLNIGSGIAFYHATRSKKLVNFLSDLNVSASYQKVIGIKKNIAQSVLKRRTENDNVFIPLIISVERPITFAIDNTDLKIDTPDGKYQLHGTATVVYQQKSEDEQVQY